MHTQCVQQGRRPMGFFFFFSLFQKRISMTKSLFEALPRERGYSWSCEKEKFLSNARHTKERNARIARGHRHVDGSSIIYRIFSNRRERRACVTHTHTRHSEIVVCIFRNFIY